MREWENQDGVPVRESVWPGNRKNSILLDSLPLFFSASAQDDSVFWHITDLPVPQDQEGSMLEDALLC